MEMKYASFVSIAMILLYMAALWRTKEVFFLGGIAGAVSVWLAIFAVAMMWG